MYSLKLIYFLSFLSLCCLSQQLKAKAYFKTPQQEEAEFTPVQKLELPEADVESLEIMLLEDGQIQGIVFGGKGKTTPTGEIEVHKAQLYLFQFQNGDKDNPELEEFDLEQNSFFSARCDHILLDTKTYTLECKTELIAEFETSASEKEETFTMSFHSGVLHYDHKHSVMTVSRALDFQITSPFVSFEAKSAQAEIMFSPPPQDFDSSPSSSSQGVKKQHFQKLEVKTEGMNVLEFSRHDSALFGKETTKLRVRCEEYARLLLEVPASQHEEKHPSEDYGFELYLKGTTRFEQVYEKSSKLLLSAQIAAFKGKFQQSQDSIPEDHNAPSLFALRSMEALGNIYLAFMGIHAHAESLSVSVDDQNKESYLFEGFPVVQGSTQKSHKGIPKDNNPTVFYLRSRKSILFNHQDQTWSVEANGQAHAKFDFLESGSLEFNGDNLKLSLEDNSSQKRDSSSKKTSEHLQNFTTIQPQMIKTFHCDGSGILPRLAFFKEDKRYTALFSDSVTAHQDSDQLKLQLLGQEVRITLEKVTFPGTSSLFSSLEKRLLDKELSSDETSQNQILHYQVTTSSQVDILAYRFFALQKATQKRPSLTIQTTTKSFIDEKNIHTPAKSYLEAGSLSLFLEFKPALENPSPQAFEVVKASLKAQSAGKEKVFCAFGHDIIETSELTLSFEASLFELLFQAPFTLILRSESFMNLLDKLLVSPLLDSLGFQERSSLLLFDHLILKSSGSFFFSLKKDKHQESISLLLNSFFSLSFQNYKILPRLYGLGTIREWKSYKERSSEKYLILEGTQLELTLLPTQQTQKSSILKNNNLYFEIPGQTKLSLPFQALELSTQRLIFKNEEHQKVLRLKGMTSLSGSEQSIRFLELLMTFDQVLDRYQAGFLLELESGLLLRHKKPENSASQTKNQQVNATELEIEFPGAFSFSAYQNNQEQNGAKTPVDHFSGTGLFASFTRSSNSNDTIIFESLPWQLSSFQISKKVQLLYEDVVLRGRNLHFDGETTCLFLNTQGHNFELTQNIELEGSEVLKIDLSQKKDKLGHKTKPLVNVKGQELRFHVKSRKSSKRR